ncbi:ABC transporter substrate-binding protein [Paenibacillus thermotolerans]|uniref:ABC transporter substrate-binding protein n=1 Tax=Paenibacillus thermotolerans TaxID=3027807 RepID=UPI0023683F5B|nr:MULTISPECIES: extracellular solute-binding protein [unclassified Paenibacillus]
MGKKHTGKGKLPAAVAAIIAMAACISLTACSGGRENAESSGSTVELNVTVMMESQGDQDEIKAWEEIVSAYQDMNPDVTINLDTQFFPGVEQHRTWVTTQLIGGTAPDIFTTRYIWDQEDLKKDLLLDLTPYMKEKNKYADDQVWDAMFPQTVLKQLVGADGTYASVPTFVNVVRVLYNKDLFKKAGIAAPPKTWSEFMDAHEKLKAIGVVPFAFPNSKPGDYNYSWSIRILTEELVAGDYGVMDADGNGNIEVNEYVRAVDQGIIDLEKSPYRDVFSIVKEWSGYWPKGFNGLDFDSSSDMFLQGKAAMVMRTSGQSKPLFQSEARKFEIGAFPLPYLTKDNHPSASGKLMEIGGVPAGNLAVPKTIAPEKLPAAMDFLKYATSPKVQGILAERLFRTPIIEKADLPEQMKGFAFVGDRMLLNIYSGEVDKNVTENNQKLGQLYLEGSLSLDDYVKQLKEIMQSGVKEKMQTNQWGPDNDYGRKQ